MLVCAATQGYGALTGVVPLQLRVHVSLPPSYSGRVLHGVHEVLNDYLMKYAPSVCGRQCTCCSHFNGRRYNENMRGVLCSYRDVKVPRAGHVVSSYPYVHFYVGLTVRAVLCPMRLACGVC